ncbi:MAG: DUF502 domain-containing protein [Synergistes sp.]|nr:DUF502 domain-containing protein [Synergistes sp.]
MDEENTGNNATNETTEKNERPSAEKEKDGFVTELFKDFLLGCVALLPLGFFIFIFFYLTIFFQSIAESIFGITNSLAMTVAISSAIILITVYIGRKLRRDEQSVFNLIEKHLLVKIPFIGKIYSALRDIVQTFTAGNKKHYLGTAKVPTVGGYIIGFVSRREILPDGKVQVSVFVPTSPNPTTGLVFFLPEEVIEYLDLTPEEAFAKIISLGIK